MSSDHYKEYDPKPDPDAYISLHKAREHVKGLIVDERHIDDLDRLVVGSGARPNGQTLKHFLGFLVGGVVGGIVAYVTMQVLPLSNSSSSCTQPIGSNGLITEGLHPRGKPWAGSTYANTYPPTSPTNYFPSLFPTNVGFQGVTVTGAEPALIATAPSQPIQTGAAELVAPPSTSQFNIFRSWGNLSPWYSVPIGTFGINESAAPPAGCDVKGLHLLYRHGARYDTTNGPTTALAARLHNSTSQWNATGSLAFLNDCSDPFWKKTIIGLMQPGLTIHFIVDLGVSMRLKYGFLLDNFTAENELPVFRTPSEARMLASTTNFALGFFGWPLKEQFEQTVIIEAPGFNNTLNPSSTCGNANRTDYSATYVNQWKDIYLKETRKQLQANLQPTEGGQGYNLTINDVFYMQQLCVYETVALGYSKFCELFTEEEWEGYDYTKDLSFWYNYAFGSPVGRVLGLGYVQELVSRLTHTPIAVYNSSTNSTLDGNARTWPLGNVLYADASHDTAIASIITALNLTSLTMSGPLPANHIPSNRSFRTNELVPFATNVQFQLLSCPALSEQPDNGEPSHIRIVINDGPVPLTGVGACPSSPSGLCPLSTFIEAQQIMAQEVDWAWGCYGNWSVAAGEAWQTTGGWYPPQP